MDDNQIIELYWKRDEDAIARSSLKYTQYCNSIALRILNDIESGRECVNDTWLNAWNSIPPSRPDSLRNFLGRITRNLSLDRVRRASREKRGGGQALLALSELEDCISDRTTPETILEDREITASIERWLDALTREKRAVFIRRYWHCDSASDIASLMGWTESKTNSLLRRLRVSLRNHLEQEGIYL